MDPIPPPAYSEKAASQPFSSSSSSGNITLAQSLSNARTIRIEETIVTSILPYLESSAHLGIGKTTLVLLPADLTSTLDLDRKEVANSATVIGFSSDEHVQLVYLPQTAGTLEFWRQHNVIPDLISRLRSVLAIAGSNVRSDTPEIASTTSVGPIVATIPPRGFFRRLSSRPRGIPRAVEGVDSDVNSGKRTLSPGEIDITAAIQDVSFRVVTEMGLYETRTDRAVVTRMEIGT